MDYKHSKMLGDDGIRIPFNCDQGFEEYYLVYVGKTPYEHERHLDKVVCARGPLTAAEHQNCIKTGIDICWKDTTGWKGSIAKVGTKVDSGAAAPARPKRPKK
jgi:hypothetical protein